MMEFSLKIPRMRYDMDEDARYFHGIQQLMIVTNLSEHTTLFVGNYLSVTKGTCNKYKYKIKDQS